MPSKDFNRLLQLHETRSLLQLPGDMIFAVLQLQGASDKTVSAVRTAQAAQSAVQLAEEAASFAVNGPQVVRLYCAQQKQFPGNVKSEVEFKTADFDAIGTENLPKDEARAKALQMAAQLYLNNEIHAIRDAVNEPAYVAGALSLSAEAAAGFRSVAKDLLLQSAETLKLEGHDVLAQKISALGADIRVTQVKIAPHEAMGELAWNYHKGGQNLMIVLSDERYLQTGGSYTRGLDKLKSLLSPQPTGGAAAVPAPKK